MKMVNGLHLYSAFTDPMATKALYILPHIHPFIHRRLGLVSWSWTPRHLVRWNRVLNHQEPLSHCRPKIWKLFHC